MRPIVKPHTGVEGFKFRVFSHSHSEYALVSKITSKMLKVEACAMNFRRPTEAIPFDLGFATIISEPSLSSYFRYPIHSLAVLATANALATSE